MARKKKVAAPVESESGTATAVAELPTELVAAPTEAEVAPVQTVVAPMEAVVTPVEAVEAPASAAPVEVHHAVSPSVPEEQPDRPRFRSWTVRTASGYEKLTDNKRGLLVLKFHDRPSEEILAAVKDGGFQYHPNYEDQGKVWLRKNDFEGRVQVDKIEGALRQQEQGAMAER